MTSLVDSRNPVFDQVATAVMPPGPNRDGGGVDFTGIMEMASRKGIGFAEVSFVAHRMASEDGSAKAEQIHYRHALTAIATMRRSTIPIYVRQAVEK